MTIKDIEARVAELREAKTAEDADLKALITEARALKEQKAEIIEQAKAAEAEAEQRAEALEAVIAGEGKEIRTQMEEKENMEKVEVRNSKEYIDAYAEFVKTGNDAECRALLTENVAGGTVPVPELVYDIVKNAWEREGVTRHIRKLAVQGNLKVGFEISGDGAIKHTEGGTAIDPENLVLGTVTLVASSFKKAVQISDEILSLRGAEFLNYIYDEIAYKIAKKIAKEIIDVIEACGTVSTATCPSVPVVSTASIGLGTIATAMAELSDEAQNPVVIMNKSTWGAFKNAQYGANFPMNIFEDLEVVFNNDMTSFAAATTGDTFAIVGDLGEGAIANFPDGEGITFKYNDLTLAKQDLVEIIGREYCAVGVVAPDAFVKIQKA